MVAGKIAGLSKQDYVWQVVPSFVTCSGSYCQNGAKHSPLSSVVRGGRTATYGEKYGIFQVLTDEYCGAL